jgi:hypothetical protein
MDDGDVRAIVAYEHDTVFLTGERTALRFGRAAECAVRIAHQPLVDVTVPRVAGEIRLLDDLVAVRNLSEKVAFDLKAPDAPLEVVRPGVLLAPPHPRFEIVCTGKTVDHRIQVQRQAVPTPLPQPVPVPLDDQPPTRIDPELTPRQWQVLAAYTEPLRRGGTSAATHREVAAQLSWSHALVRLECNAIWGLFRLAGVPMRDFRDKRDAVVDAAARHRLFPPGPTTPDSPNRS